MYDGGMNRNVIVMAGISDEFGSQDYFLEIYGRPHTGLNLVRHEAGWQRPGATLDDVKQGALAVLDSFPVGEQVATVGISGSGALSAWLLTQRPGKVDLALNVCGALSLPRAAFFARFSRSGTSLFDQLLDEIRPSKLTDERLVSVFSDTYDGLVRKSAVKFGASRIEYIHTPFHPYAINSALTHVVPRLLRERVER